MKFLFSWGEYFLSALSEIGDFLLFQPFSDPELFEQYDFLLNGKNKFVLSFDPGAYADLTIGGILFGAGLVGILTFKLIKFFLDIIF